MYHRVIIAGRLGADPEMRYTPDGTPVTTLRVATDESYSDRESGERHKRTIWWRVTVWRKQAETCNQYLTKGQAVLVEGTLVADPNTSGPRIWSGQDGKPRASFEVTAQVVRFLSGRGGEAAGAAAAEAGPEPPQNEDEMPF
jgi:single-strand DNA-binding protein